MNSCSEDIKDILVADVSLGLTFNTNLFIGKEPTKPINTVTIFDGVSSPPQLTFTQGENYFYDAIQVRVRNADSQVGYSVAQAIMLSLHGRGQTTISGTLYSVIYCSSGPALIGWDDNGRSIHVVNFEIQRR